jgi:signal transduction histidine kinase
MLSAIRNKLKGLTIRFLGVYLISLLVMMAAFIALLTALNTQQAYNTLLRTLEVGPGYLNGFQPGEVEAPPWAFYSAEEVIAEFTPFAGVVFYRADAEIFSEFTILGNEATGPVTLHLADFPSTFDLGFSQAVSSRSYYYSHLSGYEKVLLVASVDNKGVEALAGANRSLTYSLFLLPVLMILAAVFGRFVAERAVNPVVSLTRAVESMSEANLAPRAMVFSGDELGRLAQAFNRMADRLERAFTAQKIFVSDAAHELRTPLSSAKTAVSFALSQPDMGEERQQLLINVLSRLETMECLIDDLLLQARADEGDATLIGSAINIGDVMLEAAEAFQPLFEERAINFSVNTPNLSQGLVVGDAKQLLRLVSNLLDNAAKNTPTGGEVKLEAMTESGEVVIMVSDTGRGIAPEHLPRIFDRFYKVAAERSSQSGFGLGLSICRGIAIRHGGRISVESKVGTGSVFSVSLPLAG